MSNREDRERVLIRATLDADCEYVALHDDDPGHVHFRKHGATETLRGRLSPEAGRFLAGEFPELPIGGLELHVFAPTKPCGASEDERS